MIVRVRCKSVAEYFEMFDKRFTLYCVALHTRLAHPTVGRNPVTEYAVISVYAQRCARAVNRKIRVFFDKTFEYSNVLALARRLRRSVCGIVAHPPVAQHKFVYAPAPDGVVSHIVERHDKRTLAARHVQRFCAQRSVQAD